MKKFKENLKNFKMPDLNLIKQPPIDEKLNEHRAEKVFMITMIVLASLSMLIFIGGSFVKAIRMSEQPPAVTQSDTPAGNSEKTTPPSN
ncbi:hypothetical protein [Acetobacter sp.]|uniref:hypothetical protein n=1 Tax=Acetobacter sp. TaxID=440 RepID=UPI0039E7337A